MCFCRGRLQDRIDREVRKPAPVPQAGAGQSRYQTPALRAKTPNAIKNIAKPAQRAMRAKPGWLSLAAGGKRRRPSIDPRRAAGTNSTRSWRLAFNTAFLPGENPGPLCSRARGVRSSVRRVCRAVRRDGARGPYRAGADGRSSVPGPRSSRSTGRSSPRCGPARTAP